MALFIIWFGAVNSYALFKDSQKKSA